MKSSLLPVLLLLSLFTAQAQDAAENEAKVRDIVGFYQYLLNTLGGENSSTRDKEVIVKESFRKVFLDEKVQIEDDLEENRSVITYKDVRAYLLDVDFFYKRAAFELEILGIEEAQSETGSSFFKVELNRKLTATSLDGLSISNSRKRFIEINLDPETGVMKIASIYTNPFNRSAQLQEWWSTLPLSWREVFFARYGVEGDSLSVQQLQQIAQTDSLDLNGNTFISTLEPIYVLTSLRYLDISDTYIESLQPLRSTSKLEHFLAQNAPISDLQSLKFNEGLTTLEISGTRVEQIQVISRFLKLKKLDISGLNVSDFNAIRLLKSLEWLDASGTAFQNINFSGLTALKWLNLANSPVEDIRDVVASPELEELDISYTGLSDLRPVGGLPKLKILRINQTQISSLTPLIGLSKLEKVYAENIPLSEEEVEAFTAKRPKVLLVRNSKQIDQWWSGLPPEYKTVFSRLIGDINPSTEALIRFLSVDSLDLTGAPISTFQPLKSFKKLTFLRVDQTMLTNFDGIEELSQLVFFSAKLVKADFSKAVSPKKLRYLNLSGTPLASVSSLQPLNQLEYLDIDNTQVKEEEVLSFITKHPSTMVLYRTSALAAWWEGLSEEWIRLMRQNLEMSQEPSAAELHKLTSFSTLVLKDELISEFSPLQVFSLLKSLTLSRLPIGNLTGLPFLNQLESLAISEMPVTDASPLGAAVKLKRLSLSSTGVADLRPLGTLKTLEDLDISATQVKRLNGLETLTNLRRLNCSNTGVFTFGRITELTALQQITCFNTKLKENDLEVIRKAIPDCQIVYY